MNPTLRKACFPVAAAAAAAALFVAAPGPGRAAAPAGAAPATQPATRPAGATAQRVLTNDGPALLVAGKLAGEGQTVPVEQVLADPAAYHNKPVRVLGTVGEVCQVKGCWMTLGDGKSKDKSLFIKFAEPRGRLVPADAPGRKAVVEGTLVIGQISEGFARHLREDAGDPPEKIAAIKGPQKVLAVRTPVALIYGINVVPSTQPIECKPHPEE